MKYCFSWAFLAAAALAAAYGLSCFWSVDRGMAPLGFMKFMPLPLFVLAVCQERDGAADGILAMLPPIGAVMTVLSLMLGMLPQLSCYFYVNGRLSGFMQYPNTFALVLLLGIAVVVTADRWSLSSTVYLTVLSAGIFLSGSRTVFLLLAALLLYTLFCQKNLRVLLTIAGILILLLAASGIYVALTKDISSVGRYLTTSLTSSTLLGRLLYWKDALPVILSHPVGLGYLGYYFTQGVFQTGVYSVRHVHNELLQCLLDVGWIPAVFLTIAIVRGFRAGDRRRRMLLLLMVLHSMFDFDFQFVSVLFVFFLALDMRGTERAYHTRRSVLAIVVCSVLACLNVYFGLCSGAYYMGKTDLCLAMYPDYTSAWIDRLSAIRDIGEMDGTADRILRLNSSVSLAYSAKARAAYADGDLENMIVWKQEAIRLAKYDLDEYLDYFDMLSTGIGLYESAGDKTSAAYCARRLSEIPEGLSHVLEETDSLAWKIRDKPELSLPPAYQERLAEVERIYGN